MRVTRKPLRQSTDKVIHIRIDKTTHQRLKLEAALSETSIQQIVEGLLKQKFSPDR